MPYVTDTHSLVWYLTDDPALSKKAKRIFEEADNGQNEIFIPCIVFFELVYLTEKKKLPIDFDSFVAIVSASRNYKVEPLCLPIIQKSRSIPREKLPDPWDRLIVATSTHLGLPLISRDKAIRKIGVKTIW
ncbi:MAG: type II toxin-antitoxin system VapC family toxin [candidate division KSB1 bacterium]|nr:type II toxin-antitoxin system VapC family toxin [candidate division KSB1 bacterium]MDZ7303973.1 type II toxin-antitoxin system VapC family toxin [candidate division KSB1 bacterium]MDZ7313681.1 type II toxin-antitoxin system VapC family toxin [candidate division KSB1 bacterium]